MNLCGVPEKNCTGGAAMSMPRPQQRYTVDEYLAIDRCSEQRYEYFDGYIFDMAGESIAHGTISANIVGALVPQLRGKPCRALAKDTKVRSGPTPLPGRNRSGLYSYPDVLVICGEPDFVDEFEDLVVNPTVVIEVLSSTTEKFDRGEKFSRLQMWNPKLSDYLLVSQDQPRIEHFLRQLDGTWTCTVHAGLDATALIPTIDCRLPLMDVYDRIEFAKEETPRP